MTRIATEITCKSFIEKQTPRVGSREGKWKKEGIILEVVIERRSNCWDLRAFFSNIWNVIKSSRHCHNTKQNIVMLGDSMLNSPLDNTLNNGNQLPINFKRLIGLKITLVKFINPKGSLDWALHSLFHHSRLLLRLLGWFSKRTGTSFDDGKAREKD